MRKVYKQKHGSGCGLCKPHKKGWALKDKDKQRTIDKDHMQEMEKYK